MADSRSVPRRLQLDSVWTWLALAIMLGILVPLGFIGSAFFTGEPIDEAIWRHHLEHQLSSYLWNSLGLSVGVGLLAAVTGVACAWLVTMCHFPGRRFFEWGLLLPLAVPAYIMAYTYTDIADVGGPLHGAWQWLFGDQAWYPAIRSLPGAVVMIAMVLYPYVYLTCRTAFLSQSQGILEAGRLLGHGPWSCFARLALPLARPALVAGLSLVLMETLADYGTVDYFAVDTFTTGIYRAYISYQSYTTAARLAALLLLVVCVLLVLERVSRGQRRYHHTTRQLTLSRWPLQGWRAGLATTACALPLLVGFVVPTTVLLVRAIRHGDSQWRETLGPLAGNSLLVSGCAAVLAVIVALIMVYAARLTPGFICAMARRLSGLGYAVPGSVIAVALIIPMGFIDNALVNTLNRWFGWDLGLLLIGSVLAIISAYVIRFMAVALGTLDAGLDRVPQSLDQAARCLGARPRGVLWRIHVPLMRGGVATALLLIFVDAMKELPATMILRPADFNTLAVRVHQLASDERLSQAAFPALVILLVGLAPVLVLSVLISRSRSGGQQP